MEKGNNRSIKVDLGADKKQKFSESKRVSEKFHLMSILYDLDLSHKKHILVQTDNTMKLSNQAKLKPAAGFPDGALVKNLPTSARDVGDKGLILESGRSPGEGNGNALLCSCQENPMDRGAWRATVHGVTESWTGLSAHAHTHTHTHTHKLLTKVG